MDTSVFDRDFSSDYYNYEQLYGNLLSSATPSLTLDGIQSQILAMEDFAYATFFAIETGFQSYRMQRLVLESKSVKYAFLFAKEVLNADIRALQKIILSSKDKDRLKYLCKFAIFVPGANLKKIESIIAKEVSQNKELIQFAYLFLKGVKTANILNFKQAILSYGAPSHLYYLAQHSTSRREISMIEKKLMEAKSYTYIRLLAQNIELANISRLEDFILDTGDVSQIKKFGKAIKQSKSRNIIALF